MEDLLFEISQKLLKYQSIVEHNPILQSEMGFGENEIGELQVKVDTARRELLGK